MFLLVNVMEPCCDLQQGWKVSTQGLNIVQPQSTFTCLRCKQKSVKNFPSLEGILVSLSIKTVLVENVVSLQL